MPPPQVPSIAEQIWQRMHACVQGVSVESGYLVTLAAVYRGDHDPLSMTVFPVACLLPVSDTPEAGPFRTHRNVLSFSVRLWVKAGTAQHELLEQTRTAVQYAMQVDPLWGGLADDTTEGATLYSAVDVQYDHQTCDLTYQVRYRTRMEDPTAQPGVESEGAYL
jgi:hypothetical protein